SQRSGGNSRAAVRKSHRQLVSLSAGWGAGLCRPSVFRDENRELTGTYLQRVGTALHPNTTSLDFAPDGAATDPAQAIRHRRSVEHPILRLELITQLALEHLADGAAGQFVGDDHAVKALGLADLGVEPLQNVIGADAGARFGYHVAHRGFAPAGGLHAYHGHFQQVGVLAQHRFQVTGVDVEAATDDHVLASVHQGQETVLVDHPHVVTIEGLADGMQLVRVLVGYQHAGAATFGHAVELHQAARPAGQHVGLEFAVEGRAGAELHLEAGQVILVEVRAGHDALVLHRHQHG